VDGQGSAAAFHQKYPNSEFVPGVYSRPAPDVSGRDVWLLDFSYPRQQIIEMCHSANTVTVIDHHVSAMKDLMGLDEPNLNLHFNTAHSGAVLTWMHLNPEVKVPQILRYIEDRDLWRFLMTHQGGQCISVFAGLQCR
jgi:oligoribonuclease NrnB/cAMP/cGMP phosphodiesterase (DHH superfamily)